MQIYRLILIVCLTISSSALASTSKLTLFAVDLSLSDVDRGLAFDVISESILEASQTQSIGLILFDDTVRNYIAPQIVNAEQIKNLNNAIANSPNSVRATSNLAVGIERSIDGHQLENSGVLAVFARGVIDTEKQDLRARFHEWLDVVLLPQAAQSNIAITLIVPDDQIMSSEVKDSFAKIGVHKIMVSKPGVQLTPELISLLDIPNRSYGTSSIQVSVDPTIADSPRSTVVLAEQGQVDELNEEAVSQVSSIDKISGGLKTYESYLIRLGLLILALVMLFVLLFRYFRGNPKSPSTSYNTTTSSTYLPLTERPSRAMGQWNDIKSASGLIQPSSINKKKQATTSTAKGYSNEVDITSPDDTDPWDLR